MASISYQGNFSSKPVARLAWWKRLQFLANSFGRFNLLKSPAL